jgi:hypothetical protein
MASDRRRHGGNRVMRIVHGHLGILVQLGLVVRDGVQALCKKPLAFIQFASIHHRCSEGWLSSECFSCFLITWNGVIAERIHDSHNQILNENFAWG